MKGEDIMNENNQFLTSELFKLMDEVGLMQEQPKSETKKQSDEAAKCLKELFDSLVEVGFTRGEALKFILQIMEITFKK